MAPRRHRALRTPPRSTRNKPKVSYAESSDDDQTHSGSSGTVQTLEASPVTVLSSRAPKRRRRSTNHPHTRASTRASADAHTPKRRRRRAQPSQRVINSSTITQVLPSNIIPSWQTLPYQIWVTIFKYATHPLVDEETFYPTPAAQWIVQTALLCKSFAEPALTVLYSSPPLVPMVQAHLLIDCLKRDPRSLAYSYRQKIESLCVEVEQVAAHSFPGRGHLDFFSLIKDLPRLKSLEFYHQLDSAPYRRLDHTVKWTYPESIFDALEYVNPAVVPEAGDKSSICQLRSWRWSSRMAGKKWTIGKLLEIHQRVSFQALQKLAFVNYQVPSLKKDEEDPKHEELLATAIKALPKLEHLIFESSTLANHTLLPLLPTNLRNLELINCWEIVADDFTDFLLTHGHQLRCLTLNHNQSLNLSFLPILGTACPKLQTLRMNMIYFNIHTSYRDSEPLYDDLLLPDQVPIWPSTLQVIEFIQLRKWETAAAEVFFQSLLDSAGTLPDLRRLNIQAILNIGWRDRASFRDKWIGSLNRVFKRISSPPSLHQTLRPFEGTRTVVELPSRSHIKDEQLKHPAQRSSTGSASASSTVDPAPSRRSARARNNPSGTYAESSSDEDIPASHTKAVSKENAPEPRRNKLTRELDILKATAGFDYPAQTTASEDVTSDSDRPLAKRTSSSMKNHEGKGKQKDIIQGMCDIVVVRIDNLRPTEHQLTEENFIDSEKSGDEDWDGEDREVDYQRHAW